MLVWLQVARDVPPGFVKKGEEQLEYGARVGSGRLRNGWSVAPGCGWSRGV